MLASTLSEQLDSGLREFAWDEWAQMGVLAAPKRVSPWVQDPESLIVFTLNVARDDPRLFDELLDWLLVNQSLLSVRRLRSMCDGPEDEQLVDAAIGWLSQRRPGARLTPRNGRGEEELVPLFRGLSAGARSLDPAFAAAGWSRPIAEPSGKARRPDLAAPINLAFRLRELLGVGVRAEVVRFLLTVQAPHVNAQTVARSAGFAKRNVHDALASLHAAGAVRQWNIGNQQRYEIDREAWARLLGIEAHTLPVERAWPQLLSGLRSIRRFLHRNDLDDLSDYLRASQARDLLEAVRRDFEYAGIHVGSSPGDGAWGDLRTLISDALAYLRTQHAAA